MIGKKIIRRIGSGLMAGICAFTMIGTSMSGVMTASAADTTYNSAFPSADKVVKQAATLLGCKYLFGAKGYSGVYKTAADLKALDESYIRDQGIDCSGLVYYTLTHLLWMLRKRVCRLLLILQPRRHTNIGRMLTAAQ